MSECEFSEDLHKYIFNLINGESPQIAPVYDHVEQNTPYPYIKLGDINASPVDTKNSNCQRIEFNIDIFSREHGRLQIRQIARELGRLIHNRKNVELDYSRIIHIFRDGYADVKAEDNYEGTITFVALIGEKET